MTHQDPRTPGLIPEQSNVPGLSPGSSLRRSVRGSATPVTSQYARDNVGTHGGKDPRTAGLRLVIMVLYVDIVIGAGVFIYLFLNLDPNPLASGLRVDEWSRLMWGMFILAITAPVGLFVLQRLVRKVEEGMDN